MTINRLELTSAEEISSFGSKINIWGKEYDITSISTIDWMSNDFRAQIEKVHSIEHITHNASLYKDINWSCYAIRMSMGEENFLMEVE